MKWVLLDFAADLPARGTNRYALRLGGGNPALPAPVKVDAAGPLVTLQTRTLKLAIATNAPGLIHCVSTRGVEIVSPTNPIQAVLVDAGNVTYRASRPTRVAVELAGPIRSTVLVQGFFVSDSGATIHGGKIGYDLRVHAFAGRPYVKLAFALKNDGWYGYRNEGKGHPRQWLYMKSLQLDVPAKLGATDRHEARICGVRCAFAPAKPASVTQWYWYSPEDSIGRDSELYLKDLDRVRLAGVTKETP